MQADRRATLEREFGLGDLTLIVVGVVIGSGIFIVPSTVLRQVGGDPGLSMAVWLGGGVLSLLGALSYGELAAMRPEAGGLYVYLRDAFGPLPAFLYGWTLFFVIGSGSIAALSAAFTGYLEQLVPLGDVTARIAAVAMIVVVAAVNVAGARQSARLQGWTTAFKTAAILAMSIALITSSTGTPPPPSAPPRSLSPGLLMTGVGAAMIGVLWAYEGWQFATFSAGETRDPQRTFPRAIVLGTASIVVIYLAANYAYLAALGPDGVMQSSGVAASAVNVELGPAAGRLVAGAILVSIFSAANAVVLTTTRVFFAMARDGVFFRRLAELHPDRGTPAFAILVSAVWAILLSATGTFEQLLTWVVFTGWIFYALGALAVIALRRRAPHDPRPFRVPGYPFTPAVFALAAAAIVGNALFTTPVQAALGLLVVLIGAPAYFAWRSRG